MLKHGYEGRGDGDDPLLVTFAHQRDAASLEVHLVERERDQLSQAQSRDV